MKSVLRPICLCALPLALAACQGEKKTQQGTAAGEILPGSASDAMLPSDTLRSQPPLAPLPTATGKAAARSAGDDEAEAAANASAAATPAPSAAPATPEASAAAD
jgi:hypothetical protein